MASVNVSAFSGLGTFTVGKFPSGASCSRTTSRFVTPISFSTRRTGRLPEPCSGV